MRVIPKDKVVFSFNAEHPCQYSVEDGETFWVETDDCYGGQITDASVKRPDIDITIMDCSVGPIEVRGYGDLKGIGRTGGPDHRG